MATRRLTPASRSWICAYDLQDRMHASTADLTALERCRNGLARRQTSERLQLRHLGIQGIAFHQQGKDEAEIELDRPQRRGVLDSAASLDQRLALCDWPHSHLRKGKQIACNWTSCIPGRG